MLIEFTYGAHDFSHWNYTSSYYNDESIRHIIREWGERCTKGGTYSMQLVNIKDSILFGIVTSGLPSKCILYFDVLKKKFYLTANISNIYSHVTGGYAKASSAQSSNPYDAFDWGDHYTEDHKYFCYEVPDECFEDFYDEIKPYYEYDFNKKLLQLCLHSFNFIMQEPQTSPINPVPEHRTKSSFQMDCDSIFWEVLVLDMFEGNLFKEFDQKYPSTTNSFKEVLVKVQNNYLSTGDNYYDPTN